MANLDKLNLKLDIQDLDVESLIKILIENQNTLIKLVLIIVSMMIAWGMFNDHRTKDAKLHKDISQAQDKLDTIKARNAAVLDLNNFKSSVSKNLNEFELISLISKDAKLCRITIPSLSPAESKDMGLYDIINVNINAVSGNFKDMALFLNKIEKSGLPIRIDSWTGQETDNGGISFTVKISVVSIHP